MVNAVRSSPDRCQMIIRERTAALTSLIAAILTKNIPNSLRNKPSDGLAMKCFITSSALDCFKALGFDDDSFVP